MVEQVIEIAKAEVPEKETSEELDAVITAEEAECIKEVSEVLKKHGCFIAPFIKDGFDPYNPPKWGYQFISEKRLK